MNRIRKILSMVLALALVMSMGTTVYATNSNVDEPDSVIVKDTDISRVVRETNEYGSTYVEFNKVTGNFTFIYPNGTKVTIDDTSVEQEASFMADVQAEEKTFANYEYIKYRGGTWELRRPDSGPLSYYYFQIDSAAADDPTLDDLLKTFQNNVEALNTAEIAFIGATAKATAKVVLALGIGSVPAPGTKVTAASILKASGIEAGVAFTAGLVVFEACETAYDTYFEILDNYQDYLL